MNEICTHIEVKRVLQEKYFYCAQASMKMFDSCVELSQDDLWALAQSFSKEPHIWYTDPVSVESVLQKYAPSFQIHEISPFSREEIAQNLVSFMVSKKPVLIPSRAGAHWVVVSGAKVAENGDVTGVYITDPWKGMPSVAFYAFGDFFFESFFSKIRFAGQWAQKLIAGGCREVFEKASLTIKLQTELAGGLMPLESYSAQDLFDVCCFQFQFLGFAPPQEIKGGGVLDEALTIFDLSTQENYRIIPVEYKGQLAWNVLNLNKLAIETVCFSDEMTLHSYLEVKEMLLDAYPQKKVEVFPEAFFDSFSPCLFSRFDFVYKANIDGRGCYVKAMDGMILYDLNSLPMPSSFSEIQSHV